MASKVKCPGCSEMVWPEQIIKDRRSELREHWIREHLPVMAERLISTGDASHANLKGAGEMALKLIDACLDAVCGEGKR